MCMDRGSIPFWPHILDNFLTLLPRSWSDIGDRSRSCDRVLVLEKVSIRTDLPHPARKQPLGSLELECEYRGASDHGAHGSLTQGI